MRREGWRTTGNEGHEKEERSPVARSWGKGKKKMKRFQKGICTSEDGDRKEEVLPVLCPSSRRTRTPFYFVLVTFPKIKIRDFNRSGYFGLNTQTIIFSLAPVQPRPTRWQRLSSRQNNTKLKIERKTETQVCFNTSK